MKKFYFIIASISIIIIALGAILIINWVRPIPDEAVENAQFSAIVEDAGGVDTGSAFRLSFDTEISSASVRRALEISPEIEVGVHQGTSPNEVLVAPAAPLEPGTIYTFELHSDNRQLQWAIQTKEALAVEEVRPADQTLKVDIDTPLEIVLNQLTPVDLEQAADYITITPAVSGHFEQEGQILRFVPEDGWMPGTVYHLQISAGLPLEESDIVLAEGIQCSFETADNDIALWQLQGQSTYLPSQRPQLIMQAVAGQSLDQLLAADSAVSATLYQFDEADYQQLLIEMLESKPSWSEGFAYLHDTSLVPAQRLASYQLPLERSEDSASITLPQALASGYYLLRCSYAGQTMDILFAVSDLAVYVQSLEGKTIFWLHDANEGQPLKAAITDESGFVVANNSANGIAIAERSGDAVYTIAADDGRSLVVPYYDMRPINNDSTSNWRYLYLDQEVYQAGETLNYWGVVEPRDGSKLAYERVSVYIYAQEYDSYVYRDYAPLSDGVFSGSILLPTLLDGEYRLEISQSGVTLISQDFFIGDVQAEADSSVDAGGGNKLLLDQPSYQLGTDFEARVEIPGEEYLFIDTNSAGVSVTAGSEAVYDGVFSPANYLHSYLLGVAYQDGSYISTEPYLLQRDYLAQNLHIEISGSLQGERSGERGFLDITVTNAEGEAAAANVAISIVQSEQAPEIDTASAIFEQEHVRATDSLQDSLFFTACRTDGDGKISCQYDLPEFNGSCWLVVQAVDVNTDIYAGSIVLAFGQGDSEESLPQQPHSGEDVATGESRFGYSIGALTEDTLLNDTSVLAIFAAQQRIEVLSMLLEQVLADNATSDNHSSAIAALATAHARQLLLDYGGETLQGIMPDALDAGLYQKDDGGIGDLGAGSSLSTSVKAVAAAPGNIDYYALVAYYKNFLTHSSSSMDKCMALTGLALYGDQVLNDIKVMLAEEELSAAESLWLIWGLYVSGDQQNAAAYFQELLDEHDISAADAPLAAVLSSLCGSGDALSWLDFAQESGVDTSLEQVLVARVLLPQLLQPEYSFDYLINGNPLHAQMQGINDYLLSVSDAAAVDFANIKGDIYYLDIYFLLQ